MYIYVCVRARVCACIYIVEGDDDVHKVFH